MADLLIIIFGLVSIFVEFKYEEFRFRIATVIGIVVSLLAIAGAIGLGDFVLTFGPSK